jgi:hypothetical protein
MRKEPWTGTEVEDDLSRRGPGDGALEGVTACPIQDHFKVLL